MKIRLIRTGGLIPVKKAAETDLDITDRELRRLIEKIRYDLKGYRVKDANYYELSVGSQSTPVDLEKVPAEYKELFTRLKAEMKIIK